MESLSDRLIFELAEKQSDRESVAAAEIELRDKMMERFAKALTDRDGELATAECNVEHVENRAIKDLTAIVLRSDTDRDNVIEGAKIDTLILRLSLVNGITLNEEKFKERVIAEGGDIRAVQRLVNHLQHEYENDPHRMFVVDKESLKSQMEMGM